MENGCSPRLNAAAVSVLCTFKYTSTYVEVGGNNAMVGALASTLAVEQRQTFLRSHSRDTFYKDRLNSSFANEKQTNERTSERTNERTNGQPLAVEWYDTNRGTVEGTKRGRDGRRGLRSVT